MICMVCVVNDDKSEYVIVQIISCAECFKDLVIVCFGLVYKVNIDDFCESLVLWIVDVLVNVSIGNLFVVELYIIVLLFFLENCINVKLCEMVDVIE